MGRCQMAMVYGDPRTEEPQPFSWPKGDPAGGIAVVLFLREWPCHVRATLSLDVTDLKQEDNVRLCAFFPKAQKCGAICQCRGMAQEGHTPAAASPVDWTTVFAGQCMVLFAPA